jgi:DinB superfamily
MDIPTLLTCMDFARTRLLGILETIEKSGQEPAKVLAWRPGVGRAHMAWQFMHCSATYYRTLHVWQGLAVPDEAIGKSYGGGSTPSDQNMPTIGQIRTALEQSFGPFKAYIATISQDDLAHRKIGPPGRERTLGEWVVLYIWHEAHHQGQIHLTWNLYKAAHGVA